MNHFCCLFQTILSQLDSLACLQSCLSSHHTQSLTGARPCEIWFERNKVSLQTSYKPEAVLLLTAPDLSSPKSSCQRQEDYCCDAQTHAYERKNSCCAWPCSSQPQGQRTHRPEKSKLNQDSSWTLSRTRGA